VLDRLTDHLLDKEVLEGEEVRMMLGIPAPDAPGDETTVTTPAEHQPPTEAPTA